MFKRRRLQFPLRRQWAWKGNTNRPLLPQGRRQNDGRKLSKGESPGGSSSGTKKPGACRHFFTGNCLPFGEQCVFKHTEVDNQPSIKPMKSGGRKKDLLQRRVRSNWVAYSRTWSRRNSSRILRKSTKVLGPMRSVHFSKCTLCHLATRERKGPSQGVRQNTRIEHRRKTLAKNVHKTERKGQSHVLLAFRSLVITSAIFEETPRKENSWWTPKHQCTC